MPIIAAGPHYKALRQLLPKCFKGAATGPVLSGWWKADDNTDDVIGFHNAVWVGSPVYDTGYAGKCFKTGSEKYLTIPYHADLNATVSGQLVVEFYFKKTALSSDVIFGKNYDESGAYSWGFSSYYDGPLSLCLQLNPAGEYQVYDLPSVDSGDPYAGWFVLDSWVKVKTTYNDSRWNLCINDVLLTPRAYNDTLIDVSQNDYWIGGSGNIAFIDNLKISKC